VSTFAMREVAVPVPPRPPYAAPLRAVDEVLVDRLGDRLTIRARLAIDPADLQGHFPGLPIYPGVYVLESLAQAVGYTVGQPVRPTTVHSVRFLAPLFGGDELRLHIQAQPEGNGWRTVARGTRSDGTAAAEVKAVLSTVEEPGEPVVPATVDGPALEAQLPLPHGHPMVLVDRVPALVPGRAVVAEKAITRTEPCYRDPTGSRAYPVSLMLESLGQAAALAWLRDAGPVASTDVLMFVGLRGYRVTGAAYPGDVLRHVVELVSVKADTAFATGGTWVGGRRIASVDTLIAAVRPRTLLGAPSAPDLSTTEKEAGR
jgi:3-hydroxymyristoyl/3-hydroxydecanoyl-(acyl carrier protein) dehydratase